MTIKSELTTIIDCLSLIAENSVLEQNRAKIEHLQCNYLQIKYNPAFGM